jgi:uncharacterized phage protein (TIGR01671 family)
MADWEDVRTMPICEVFGVGHLVPELWTGLKDKNGKEIYDGDIISIDGGEDPAIGPVEFEAGCFVVKCEQLACGTDSPELKYYIGMSFCETVVIGNIHEPPTPD